MKVFVEQPLALPGSAKHFTRTNRILHRHACGACDKFHVCKNTQPFAIYSKHVINTIMNAAYIILLLFLSYAVTTAHCPICDVLYTALPSSLYVSHLLTCHLYLTLNLCLCHWYTPQNCTGFWCQKLLTQYREDIRTSTHQIGFVPVLCTLCIAQC